MYLDHILSNMKLKKHFFIVMLILTAVAFMACNSKAKGKIVTSKNSTDSCGITLPAPIGYTNDFTSLFTIAQKLTLDSIISSNEKQTSNYSEGTKAGLLAIIEKTKA